MKKRIKINELAAYRNVQVTNKLNKQANLIFSLLMNRFKAELYKTLKKNKLAKSEDPIDDGLESGWTGEVPKIDFDMSAAIGQSLDKYLQALRWMMLGNYAGKAAREAAEAVGLVGKVVPGILQSAYLNTIDAHREHHEDMTGEEAPEMPKKLVKASFDKILERSDKFLKQSLNQIKLNIVSSVDRIVEEKRHDNLSKLHTDAHDLAPSLDPAAAVAEAADRISNVISLNKLSRDLSVTNRKNISSFARLVDSEINLSSATASHQALLEIHGKDDDSVRVVWIAFVDEKTCSFCENASRNKAGEFKFYKIDDFKPAGYNYNRKKSDWVLTIPGAHINCRCKIIYLPRGFDINSDGTIFKK